MPIDLQVLRRRTDPQKTILLFGAGSSVPSGGYTSQSLVQTLENRFAIDTGGSLQLPDIALVIEKKFGRRELVKALHEMIEPLRPAQGVLNLPDFDWAGIYTTNYDKVIERSYQRRNKMLNVISSNFDFSTSPLLGQQTLYKLHGTIDCDVVFGHQHRMIISGNDYDLTHDYRESLYARFTEQLFTNNAIIIGQSLADPDLRSVVDHAVKVKRDKGAPGHITLFAFTPDEHQALIYESRGLDVCFGGIDDFFAEMSQVLAPAPLLPGITDDPLDRARSVHPSTITVATATANETGNLSRMFNGSPANYADIIRGWTFERDFSEQIETQLSTADNGRISYVLGFAGSGKTTGVRKALIRLSDRGMHCWEHKNPYPLHSDAWKQIDDELRKRSEFGVLFIDDAHEVLHEVNDLVEDICNQETHGLKIVLASTKPQWNPRLKTPSIFSNGHCYEIGTLSSREIGSLLDMLETNTDIKALVEESFIGFNRSERQRRLAERCRADMFVCMRNIFASDSFDEIILREYAELGEDYQEVYRRVAGMEASGVKVHRQLVLRTIGIPAREVQRYLVDLEGIIEEITISERDGIFAWHVRHETIADIIARRKIADEDEYFQFLRSVVQKLNPSYPIEISSMNEMCDPKKGIGRIYDKEKQNRLLRQMISLAPRQRVPRHRLIRNLIDLGDFDNAGTEIRIFENELKLDGPVQRYKAVLMLERAKQASGILDEDRASMIKEAAALAESGVERFQDDKNLYRTYLEIGVTYLKYKPDRTIFDRAKELTHKAYDRILDPEIGRILRHFERVEQRFAV